MIISASRRTDIPTLYSEWFMNRVRAGNVQVQNPRNPRQVSTLSLSPGDVDCIVFWTRDPGPMLPHLEELDSLGFHYYFMVTVNHYPRILEPGGRNREAILDSCRELTGRIGSRRLIWRYDPVLFAPGIDAAMHAGWFSEIARKLEGSIDQWS